MKTPIFQVDAFTSDPFKGSPVVVCPLESWLPDETLRGIASENWAAETAFLVASEANGDETAEYRVRFFSSIGEGELSEPAAFAVTCVALSRLDLWAKRVRMHTRTGAFEGGRTGRAFTLELPARPSTPVETPDELEQALGAHPVAVLKNEDYVAVLDCATAVQSLTPDLQRLGGVETAGVAVTAPGEGDTDYVARVVAPPSGSLGVEGPATVPHTTLAPLWARRLGKTELQAREVSARTGELHCAVEGDRVRLTGEAVIFLEGQISL